MKNHHTCHVAVRVKDLEWHRGFFRDVFGMEEIKFQGDPVRPDQVWLGCIQLTRDEQYAPRPQAEERVWHVGLAVKNREEMIRRVGCYPGVSPFTGKAEHWFILPEGLALELVEG